MFLRGATKTFQYSPKTEITAIKLLRYDFPPRFGWEEEMESTTPTIIDLDAEAAKLTMFRGQTPQTTRAERKGSTTQLGRYRDGLLVLGKSAGTGHWETHPEDELVCVLDGAATLDIAGPDGPQSFALGAGMLAVVPQSAWHRFRSADGRVTLSTTLPGDHLDLDVADPRSTPDFDVGDATRPPGIIDLNAELAKLTMFRRTPQSTAAERTGSGARLASYRDGALFAIKMAGKDRWEAHPAGDELIHLLDGAATLDMVCDDGSPRSFALRAGMLAVIPRGAWHRFRSAEGATLMSATPFPGEIVALDVDDPRTAAHRPATERPGGEHGG